MLRRACEQASAVLLCIASGTTSEHAGIACEVVTRMVVYGSCVIISVTAFFDGLGCELFDCLVCGSASRRDRARRRAHGRQGRYAPLTRWPEGGPAAALPGLPIPRAPSCDRSTR
jgi:hypothetical protein